MSRVHGCLRVGVALPLLAAVAACGSGETSSTAGVGHTRVGGPVKSPTAQLIAPLSDAPGSSTASSPRSGKPPATQGGSALRDARSPYIAKVVWVSLPSGRSLQIYPTARGRTARAAGAEGVAWREVLRKAPNAASPGMRAQFDCHWAFARLAAPHKVSWNLEPWRPVVSAQRMYDTGCNPGGPEV